MSVRILQGDMREIVPTLSGFDACVCDPPYHLTSIVKRFANSPRTEATVGKHAYGRHAAGFMGKHWDGGRVAFEPETWRLVLDAMKPGAYLVAFASTRGYHRMTCAIEDAGFIIHPLIAWIFGSGFPKATRLKCEGAEGWRYGLQAMKPAIEPICLAQKPMEGTGTENWLHYGVGALNIDGCRVATWERGTPKNDTSRIDRENWRMAGGTSGNGSVSDLGRWPANVLTDGSDEVLACFPDAPGQNGSISGGEPSSLIKNTYGGARRRIPTESPRNDSGSAARFFYTAKADATDRHGTKHPTVKPLDLMQWLVRLVTPPGGHVLDCFAGSGTTGEACQREGFDCTLIEREAEYVADIERRIKRISGEDTPLFAPPAADPQGQRVADLFSEPAA